MDPLSVTASIVGILAAAGKISELLHIVLSSAKEAPKIVTALVSEIEDVRSAFSSLQDLLANLSSAPPRRTALIQVDRLIVTLTETVLTFSELETIVIPLAVPKGQKFPLRTRLKWTRVEGDCARMVEKLQRHKASVSLMLNVLQCASDAEAARSQASLEIMVEQLLQTNRGLCKRMRNLEDSFDARTIKTHSQFDTQSLMSHGDTATITTSRRRKHNRISMVETFRIRFTFDDDLESSRVYSRLMLEDSCDRSFNSSAVRTNAWSVFSGLSLADISVMSVVALPIYPSDIKNQGHYAFGDVDAAHPSLTIDLLTNTPSLPRAEVQEPTSTRMLMDAHNDTMPHATIQATSQTIQRSMIFCQKCQWFRDSTVCPMCRSKCIELIEDDGQPSLHLLRQKQYGDNDSVLGYDAASLPLHSTSSTTNAITVVSDMTVLNKTILKAPSVINPVDVTLNQHLSEIIEAQRMLEDDDSEVENNNVLEHMRPVVTKKAASNTITATAGHAKLSTAQVVRNTASVDLTVRDLAKFVYKANEKPLSPCPICSGHYLADGQILDLAGTKRHDRCRICSECREPVEWIAQVVLRKSGMPGLLCTVCIGNSSPAALEPVEESVDNPIGEPADELMEELVDEPADQPVDEPAEELPIEPAKVVNRRAKIGHQTYRRRTWSGNTQDDTTRRGMQDKRLSAGNETSKATEITIRPSISNDYNFWQDERFPIVQTWKGKAKTTLVRPDCTQVDIPSTHHLAQGNIREQPEMSLPLVEEHAQEKIGEQSQLEMELPSTEQRAQRALSLFDFSFQREERARDMLGRQENPETQLLLPEHTAQALVANYPEMELPLTAHVPHALSV